MKDTRKSDLIWSWTLVGLNILSIILGIIPGFIKMYDKKAGGYIGVSLLSAPATNLMNNLGPLLMIVFVYCLIVGFTYLRGQSLGAIRGCFVGCVSALGLSLMALLPHHTVAAMPYAIIPGIWAVQSVLAFIRMKQEKRRMDALGEATY